MNSSRGERHRAVPRLPVAAVILVAEGDAAFVEARRSRLFAMATRWV